MTLDLDSNIVPVQPVSQLQPFGVRFMETGASAKAGGKTATSRQTIEDGEEEADTDWDDT